MDSPTITGKSDPSSSASPSSPPSQLPPSSPSAPASSSSSSSSSFSSSAPRPIPLRSSSKDSVISISSSSSSQSSSSSNSSPIKPRSNCPNGVSISEQGKIRSMPVSHRPARLVWPRGPPSRILLVHKHHDIEVDERAIEISKHLREKYNATIIVQPSVHAQLGAALQASTYTDEEAKQLDSKVDVVICLGGDGTFLHAASLFGRAHPPVLSFNMGSLGFLTPFDIDTHPDILEQLFRGDLPILIRMRLKCTVVRGGASEKRISTPCGEVLSSSAPQERLDRSAGDDAPAYDDHRDKHDSSSSSSSDRSYSSSCESSENEAEDGEGERKERIRNDSFLALNEVVLDRGPSPYLTNLDVFVDGTLVTTVQADGLILATPTGSTAYSMSAGGSIVHPSVPCILLTPICPHSLSFRPLLLPDSAEITIQVPIESRSSVWASFDGRNRQELRKGDAVRVSVSPWPVPAICRSSSSCDWFQSLAEQLHFNYRQKQRPLKS